MDAKEKKFWIVWCPTGTTPPKFQHQSEHEAASEAGRLARLHVGQKFIVLEATRGFQVRAMIHTEYENESPF